MNQIIKMNYKNKNLIPIFLILGFLFFSQPVYAETITKTLYAWARDLAGNISLSLNDSVDINLPSEPANTFYISSSTGSDTNNGTSPSTPWKTIAKVNTQTFTPGASILFKSGDIWTGETITVNSSGNSTSPITYSSYGIGEKPVISGFTDVASWTNIGNNIWESTNVVSSLSTVNMVVINNTNTPMGRTPNTGYYYYQSHSGATSITSSDLTGTPNWTGAELAFNNTTYTTKRVPITNQSGGTLTFTQDPTDSLMQKDGLKFIIQKDIRTLDQQNEWYYNPTTKKLSVYSSSQPSNVKVSSVAKLVTSISKNYITFSDISFTGSNSQSIYIGASNYFTIQNVDINFSGMDAIHGSYHGNAVGFIVEDSTISNSNSTGIAVTSLFTGNLIRNNMITNTGMIFGSNAVSVSGTNGSSINTAISASGDNSLIEYNTITNVGYIGIAFNGNNTIVQNNYITNYSQNQNDGGAIYTWNGPKTVYTGIKVLKNIIINNPVDTDPSGQNYGAGDVGIYLDYMSNGIEISDNTVNGNATNLNNAGIFLGGNKNILVQRNILYNNSTGLRLYNNSATDYGSTTSFNNIFVAKTTNQIAMHLDPIEVYKNEITMDNNIYARPILDTTTIKSFQRDPWNYYQHTLSDWQIFSSQDLNSDTSPVSITDPNDILFEYNATQTNKVVSLGSNTYVDVTGASYTGSVTLLPYTSIILIKTN